MKWNELNITVDEILDAIMADKHTTEIEKMLYKAFQNCYSDGYESGYDKGCCDTREDL